MKAQVVKEKNRTEQNERVTSIYVSGGGWGGGGGGGGGEKGT